MTLFLQCLVTLFAIFVPLILYMKWMLKHWKRKNIPYLKPTFPFGNLQNPLTNRKSLSLHFQEFYKEFKKMGAKCGGIYQFCAPVLLVIDPASIRLILTKEFQHFHERGFYNDGGIGSNLFTIDGERWKVLRSKFSHTFTSAKVKGMFKLMVDVSRLFEEYVGEHAANGKALDVKDCISRLSSDIIGTCAFGIDCNSFKNTAFHELLNTTMIKATTFLRISFYNALPKLARVLGLEIMPEKEAQLLCNSIDKTIAYRIRNDVRKNDFLQQVVELKDENIINMDELRAQCVLFLLAGYETASNAIIFFLFEMAFNQDIQQKLREEINEILAEYGGEVTYEAVEKMKYLEMVINETLRKYPPIAFLNRNCVMDFKLPDSDIVIKKGTKLIISNYAIQHDPDHFPKPDNFDPERFSDANKHKIMPYTYLPFGEGPRYCIGKRFAKMEMKITGVSLVKKYKFQLHKMVKMPLEFNPTGIFTTATEDILFDIEEIR